MYSDPATGGLLFVFLVLAFGFVIFAPIVAFISYFIKNGKGQKPRFPRWAVILWGLLCAWFAFISPYVK